MFYSIFATFLLPYSSSSLERALELTPGYPFPGAFINLINRVRRVLPKYFLPYYLLFFSYLLIIYLVINIKIDRGVRGERVSVGKGVQRCNLGCWYSADARGCGKAAGLGVTLERTRS